MKKLLYISLSIILLSACASDHPKSLQKEKSVPNAKIEKSEDEIEKPMETKEESIEEKRIKKNVDKGLTQSKAKKSFAKKKSFGNSPVKKSANSKRKVLNATKRITDAYLNDISKQKLQQIYDIASLVHKDSTQQDMKEYALKYANRLFVRPDEKISEKLNKIGNVKADSIKIEQIKLIDLTETEYNGQIGRYAFNTDYYRQGKIIYRQKHIAEIYFEITNLNFDGEIHQTVKSRIKRID